MYNSWKNVTNQPGIGSNVSGTCDNHIQLWNTSLTLPPFAPMPVKGDVSIVEPYYVQNTTFRGVYGIRLADAYVERNNVPCESLAGYSGTGTGD